MHASVCDFIIDCVQNSIEANAEEILLFLYESTDDFSIKIIDNGAGMTDEEVQNAVDPFYTDGSKHKERKVGLGIPFMIQSVEQVSGKWAINSKKGRGTELSFNFPLNNIDTPPIGDISGMLLQVLMFDGDFELKFDRVLVRDSSELKYTISRLELKEVLGDLNSADSLILAKQYLRSQEEDLIEGDS
ncbi:MAG: ATP-binding protein [Spirochaetales bacterium]|nr:ATP-binding protein [Spirochaetales bacterium]